LIFKKKNKYVTLMMGVKKEIKVKRVDCIQNCAHLSGVKKKLITFLEF